MGGGFSKFVSGAGKVAGSLIGALPNLISKGMAGAQAGKAAGPWGAGLAAAANVLPDAFGAVRDATNAVKPVGGPENIAGMMDDMLGRGLTAAHTFARSPIFRGEGAEQARGWTDAMQRMREGQTMRGALAHAGVSQHGSTHAMRTSATLDRKVHGLTGLPMRTAMALGNPALRATFKQSKASVFRHGMDRTVRDYARGSAGNILGSYARGMQKSRGGGGGGGFGRGGGGMPMPPAPPAAVGVPEGAGAAPADSVEFPAGGTAMANVASGGRATAAGY